MYNVKLFFRIKDKVGHLTCVIYEVIFCCGSDYIGETSRNSGTRFREHKKLI